MKSLKSCQIQRTDRAQNGEKLGPKRELDLRPLGGGSNSLRAPSLRDVAIMMTVNLIFFVFGFSMDESSFLDVLKQGFFTSHLIDLGVVSKYLGSTIHGL
ncbi:hypothetical protein Ancab_010925 [Ancistrocladus abbreviatus]